MNWYQMESQEVMDKLNRFKDRGLSQKEVIKRQRHYGKNELQSEKGPGFFRQFAAQFKDFMILTLLAAAGISFFASYAQGEMKYNSSPQSQMWLLSVVSHVADLQTP